VLITLIRRNKERESGELKKKVEKEEKCKANDIILKKLHGLDEVDHPKLPCVFMYKSI